jgi:hypothetical protein
LVITPSSSSGSPTAPSRKASTQPDRRAGSRAIRRSANAEAVSHLRTALDLVRLGAELDLDWLQRPLSEPLPPIDPETEPSALPGVGARVVAFDRVAGAAAAVHVILASPSLTDRLCAPAATLGRFSCHNRGNVVINFTRWMHGGRAYGAHLDRYRTYVVNHEVGHALGRGHLGCPGPGKLAPVMMQQTKGVGACRPNPRPRPYEL